ncbi:Transcriptional regulator, contains XRE-family HTH domain [Aureimonas jatrophae]|uniref:Transcriptional regulator, contains XRE-family HTH domain n=2 Tax=Aureimonas jatrophae TaxID=1166073 RepID=A0A1H0DDH5_9HYPH|nr:Transcriptional regulator, contains XRE-family HTH domain [Aureimonas jatrophae]
MAQLGHAVGVSYQQIQKYEVGDSRMSAATLYRLARVLDVPLIVFFQDADSGRATEALIDDEIMRLMSAIERIPDTDVRLSLRRLLACLGDGDGWSPNSRP